MADLVTEDPRAAAWERRLLAPVIVAAVAVLPLLALHLSHPHAALAAATVLYMATGDAPLEGAAQSLVLVVAGMLATFATNHLRRRRDAPARAAP